jgi:hypothetical protein
MVRGGPSACAILSVRDRQERGSVERCSCSRGRQTLVSARNIEEVAVNMRAEVQQDVDAIKQSVGLLRRHL